MKNKLLCSTRLPSLITAIGSAPLFFYAFWPALKVFPVIYAFIYIYSVIAFIAGINWVVALMSSSLLLLLWSIVLSLLPIVILGFYHLNFINNIQVWVLFLALLWVSLLIDYIVRKSVNLKYYFCFRRSGTIFLSIAIIINIFFA